MAIGEGVRVSPKTTFPLSGRENIPKRARRERSKEVILLLPHQLPVRHPHSHSSDNELATKRFKEVPQDEWYKYKISKSMVFFGNELFQLHLPGKEPFSFQHIKIKSST